MADKWQECRWGDIATLEYGKGLRGYQDAVGPYPVYGTNGPIGKHSEPLCSHPGVIIGRKGAYRGVHYSKKPFFVIDTAFYLEPKVDIDLRWAYYELLTHDINSMDSGSAIPSTSRNAFYNLRVKVPPVGEQKAIANILGTLDDKTELNHQMNETLESMAKALFKSWFIDFDPVRAKMEGRQPVGMDAETAALFPDSFEGSPLGKIPRDWKVGSLSEIAEITMGQSPPGKTYNESGEGLPFYQGIRDFGFRFPGQRVYCTVPTRLAEKNDVLISVRAPVGSLNVASEQCAIGRGLGALRLKRQLKISHNSFLFYSLTAAEPEWNKFEAGGTVFGSITKKDLYNLKILIPNLDILGKFSDFAGALDDLIALNEAESSTLASIRDTLLPKLLSGEIRVKDAERLKNMTV